MDKITEMSKGGRELNEGVKKAATAAFWSLIERTSAATNFR